MVYWSGQAVNGTSDDYGLMEDLLQIRETDEDEENLYYSRYGLGQHDDDREDDPDDYDEFEDDDEDYDDEDDLVDDEDLDEDIEDEEDD